LFGDSARSGGVPTLRDAFSSDGSSLDSTGWHTSKTTGTAVAMPNTRYRAPT
jgi:hypothetical protein